MQNQFRLHNYHHLATSNFVGIILTYFISKDLTKQMQDHIKLHNYYWTSKFFCMPKTKLRPKTQALSPSLSMEQPGQ